MRPAHNKLGNYILARGFTNHLALNVVVHLNLYGQLYGKETIPRVPHNCSIYLAVYFYANSERC